MTNASSVLFVEYDRARASAELGNRDNGGLGTLTPSPRHSFRYRQFSIVSASSNYFYRACRARRMTKALLQSRSTYALFHIYFFSLAALLCLDPLYRR